MVTPTDAVSVSTSAFFDGGSSAGGLTAGILTIGADFLQGATFSPTSFAPSGSHTTILTPMSSGGNSVFFQTPGVGASGSHFQGLDVTGASGGIFLDGSVVADSVISDIAESTPTIHGAGFSLIMRRVQIAKLLVDDAPIIIDEQGTAADENFSNVTFQSFVGNTDNPPTLLSVTGPGGDRPAFITDNVNFQESGGSLTYVRLVSSDGAPFTLTMNGSNRAECGDGAFYSDPPNETTVSGATILWPVISGCLRRP
jgi:hypothetical protein